MLILAGIQADYITTIYVPVWQPACNEFIQVLREFSECIVNVLDDALLK
jgi:hypothetical protein